jgi:hypothetical protein
VPGGLSEEQAGVNHAQKRYQGGCEPKLTMDLKNQSGTCLGPNCEKKDTQLITLWF